MVAADVVPAKATGAALTRTPRNPEADAGLWTELLATEFRGAEHLVLKLGVSETMASG